MKGDEKESLGKMRLISLSEQGRGIPTHNRTTEQCDAEPREHAGEGSGVRGLQDRAEGGRGLPRPYAGAASAPPQPGQVRWGQR